MCILWICLKIGDDLMYLWLIKIVCSKGYLFVGEG